MDPNETLKEMKALAQKMSDAEDNANHAARQEAAEEIAWRFIDLDEWLSKGGYLPSDWQH